MDGQSVKTTEQGGPNRYDAAKDIRGRQRHLLVDTTGLILLVIVHLADPRTETVHEGFSVRSSVTSQDCS